MNDTTQQIITEEQLLKMKDNAETYMNDEQQLFFRHKLINLAASTKEHIEQVRLALSAEERNTDTSDQATQTEERSLQLRIIDRELKLLKKIEYSLTQLDNNEYGYCEETGEPIGIQRLLLRPTATLSVDAKSILEEKEKEFNDDVKEPEEGS